MLPATLPLETSVSVKERPFQETKFLLVTSIQYLDFVSKDQLVLQYIRFIQDLNVEIIIL